MSNMLRFSWLGLVKFRPFDEREEDSAESNLLHKKMMVLLLNCVAALCVTGALIALVFEGTFWLYKLPMLSVACVAVVAGIYWNEGLKAKSLNQLFMAVIFLAMFTIVK